MYRKNMECKNSAIYPFHLKTLQPDRMKLMPSIFLHQNEIKIYYLFIVNDL